MDAGTTECPVGGRGWPHGLVGNPGCIPGVMLGMILGPRRSTVSKSQILFSRRKDVLSKTLSEQTILLNLETGDYFQMNETGMKIWALLDRKCSAEDVASALTRRIKIPPARARAHVDRFLKALRDYRLIEAA